MGNVISNLKVKFGIDTSDFKRGLKDGEKAMGEFKDAAGNKISDFASMFGVNMYGVTSAVGIASKSLGFLKQSFIGATEGSNALAVSGKALKWVFASTGIGALIMILGSLTAYFSKTTKGAKELASGMAQLKAAGTVYLERVGQYGGGLLEIFKGNFAEGFNKIKQSITGIGGAMLKAAEAAKIMAASEYELSKQERQFSVWKSEQLVKLEEYRLKSRDIELSAKERLAALNSAAEIEKKINKEAVGIAAERLLNAQTALQIDTQSKDKKNELAEAYVHYNETVADSIIFERSLARQKNTLTKEIRAELAAMKEANDVSKIYIEPPKVYNPKGPQVDPSALRQSIIPLLSEVDSQLKDMYEATETSVENLVIGFGDWIGAFSSGIAGFRDLRQMVGNTFGDMLIALGTVAIKTGITMEAIKNAFKTMNGAVAIAAGIGLIAFGSSIKGSISQINDARSAVSSGGGSVSSGSTGGGSLTYGSGSVTPSKLKIEGTVLLKLTGADLLALLNAENTRIEIVT